MKLMKRYLLLVVALVMPLTFAGAHTGQRLIGQSESDSVTRKKIGENFAEAIALVENNYAGRLDFERVYKASILGMLHTLDPHSSYFDRKEWESFQNDQRSRYTGIGASIAARNGKVYVMATFNGTPAHRAGIRFGDHIVGVNGESTEGWTSQQVSSKLLGPEGTPVTVKVGRLGVGQPVEYKLTRAAVGLPSITNYYLLPNGVGYINLERGFNTTTHEEMREAMLRLEEQGMHSLILDLRNNRGGLVDQAWKVTNVFLYRGQKILSMRGRPGVFQPRELVAFNPNPEEFPLVVLINRGSASASEIVAGALQDHDRARIVGENSFGKGLVQSVWTLNDGSGLTLTTGHYYTPSGRLIQREYSGRSFYDYYLRRGDKEAVQQRTDEKRTDSGRTVYGGGGIEPDVEVKFPAKEAEYQRVWLEPVFLFARQLAGGQVAGLNEFKIDRPIIFNHKLGQDEYRPNDKVLAAFKSFLRSQKDYAALESRLDKDADWVKRQIRYEIVTAAYGQELGRQALLEGDAQMQRAVGEIPKAKSILEDFRRMRASKNGDMRRD